MKIIEKLCQRKIGIIRVNQLIIT